MDIGDSYSLTQCDDYGKTLPSGEAFSSAVDCSVILKLRLQRPLDRNTTMLLGDSNAALRQQKVWRQYFPERDLLRKAHFTKYKILIRGT
ncbi:jg8970 [Pararge aegeria aegeria]|uniref:Jg8970 protein n=1 Tax=Pararge aegeria aegeria TaxID=348720 RepID=A0A8S4QIG9_9NEOP|nr:jg8970 [Pararge aegeria aegeria]